MQIAYIRVSTEEQNEARQVEAMKKFDIERWYIEKCSGKNMIRVKLVEMLDFCREGDVIHIHDFSRLARSTKDLLHIVEVLEEKKVSLVSNKEALDTRTPTGKLMLTVIAAINEFERTNLLERQREGIAIAKQEGRYLGRKAIEIPADTMQKLCERYFLDRESCSALARECGISVPTMRKKLRQWEENHGKAMALHKAEGGAVGEGDADDCSETAGRRYAGDKAAEK